MRPRWHFVLRSVFFGLIFLTVLLITLFVAGFLVLALRVSGVTVMSGFGFKGVLAFLRAFPWLITLLLLVLMLAVEIYARRYSFCYRLPALGTLTILLMMIGTAGLALGYYLHYNCPGHNSMFGPTLGHLRASVVDRSDMLHAGKVRNFSDQRRFQLETPTDVYRVVVTEDTRGTRLELVEVGDEVLVFGPVEGDSLKAVGLRKLPPDGSRPYHARGGCPPQLKNGSEGQGFLPGVINGSANP